MSRTHRFSSPIDAGPARVYAALTHASELALWLPPAGMKGRFERFAAGQGFRMILAYTDPAERGKAGGGRDVVDVTITEAVDGARITWASEFESDDPEYAGTMTMTWELEPDGDRTRLTVTARDVPPGISQEDHTEGMRTSVMQLNEYLSRGFIG
ncbi:SRPBCC domain-containing protein [Tsukamurella sp. 8F]|uniref:SRPBCC domain-containing protein n=1 Tax=unclassified Tsukamurella TaxID=2633480 RepID=UPI0023B96D3A|nr:MULTISPECIES: SRPBCC domain-containing protein [unclassified Tsukamurella]MDF0529130.1 SRPBCC domain-containing protein [Tsukamurella sp. 8J]MDF0588120.1 SRPBCC domain-containing protein [Tsukamurella sp. 8F]